MDRELAVDTAMLDAAAGQLRGLLHDTGGQLDASGAAAGYREQDQANRRGLTGG